MSEEIAKIESAWGDISVTGFCGPASLGEGSDRACVTIAGTNPEVLKVDRSAVLDLAHALLAWHQDTGDYAELCTIFGRTFKTYPVVAFELEQLEETGCITTTFAIGDDEARSGVFRVRYTPREIYLLVDSFVRGVPLPAEVEAVYCGQTPWRYERLSGEEAELWRDCLKERAELGAFTEKVARQTKRPLLRPVAVKEDPDA